MLTEATVRYDEGLYMQCHVIESVENPTPLNLLEYFSNEDATEILRVTARFAVAASLDRRNVVVEDALPLDGASDVFNFIGGKLGMQPVGELYCVPYRDGIKTSGVTYPNLRKTFIFRDNITQDFNGSYLEEAADMLNGIRLQHVAAHELTHLAGAQDRVFYTIDHLGNVEDMIYPGTTLEGWPKINQGKYFEEGLGSLVGAMYLWDKYPKLSDDDGTAPFKSRNSGVIHLPKRINSIGHHEYAFCAWGVENLIKIAPEIWDIMLASRKYNTGWMSARVALKECVDRVMPGYGNIFEEIDETDIEDLDSVMQITEKIGCIAAKHNY